MKKIVLLLFLLNTAFLFAQKEIKGTVKDKTGTALPGVNIVEKGTNNGVSTDYEGGFIIKVKEGATLIFSYVGYSTVEKSASSSNLTITLDESGGQILNDVVVVGSRNTKRTVVNSAVPIDVINVKDVTTQSGKLEINELLQYVAPSFNANKQSGSDGADHVDPASLRGMGPDQTLVLINGKRRHQSSLINLFGTRGRGNTGTDLNAIPASSIKRIEILRDGAAAQYGSDAIAGVINIVTNDNVNELTGSVTYGLFNTNAKGDFLPGTPNTDGFRLDQKGNGNSYGKDKSFDGQSIKVAANYGVSLGSKGGYANFTGEFINKEKTLRPSYDFRKGFGDAQINGVNFFGNLAIPLADKTELYAFGGSSLRNTDAYAFTRNDGERVVESVYPGGYTPRITSKINDNSIAAGIRTETSGGWKMDLSNTFGKNKFHYNIEGTINASLEDKSPHEFDAGGHSLLQNTTNFDISKNYDDVMSGFNIAFGTEFRVEKFEIFAGEEGSYTTYDTNGVPITDPTTQSAPTVPNPDYDPTDPTSSPTIPRPGSSQGFPGYSPANEVNESRTNFSLYTDAELDITEGFMVTGAVRFENYSDFGSTINGKLASRLKLSDHINMRGSISTGFRAPSLAQIYYNLRFTNFNASGATEVLLAPNNSPVTQAFGIEKLNEEKAVNASLGFTGTFGDFTATVDGYYIKVKDRIVLTGYFDAEPLNLGVSEAQFFANGVDTSTHGLDLVFSWKKSYDFGNIGATLVGNINDMKIDKVKNGDLDADTFFGKREKAFLLASAPDSKFGLNLNYSKNKFDAGLAFTRFSKVVLVDYADEDDVYNARLVTDLTLGYRINKSLKLSIGSNNLFNVYPTKQDEQGNTEAGGYWDAVQMGFSGAYYYARLGFNF
ncbi:iron complex outermembrane recepter protein [Flavobacterium aquidurense]|uniref:TonB-dependent receptor n=1 Tax=Flavobacterium frigidimaris TaxID=262320 RepID=A0ABX4BKP6_FLAFR|nr:TonB-dependent receptor [Flavobacterium frigidimaris]OXA76127.1 TonB-dependent receptor [Flavobacterium frigidimaris]SDY33753.1 iron complex outermembrane recepter protein [Flavobacterium aquidurense]